MKKRKNLEILRSIILLILSLIGFLPSIISAQQRTYIDGVVAKVDNYVVLQSEWETAYGQLMASGQQTRSRDLKCEVLRTLIINKMLLAKSDIDSITVDPALIDDQMDRRMNYFISTFGSKEKLEQYYGKTLSQLKDELRGEVKEQMLIQKVEEGITRDLRITPKDVKKFFNQIPKDSIPYLAAEVEVAQIVLLPIPNPQAKKEAKQQLEAIKQRILDGESFEELARQYSEDPGSKGEGGQLGWVERGIFVPEFEAEAFNTKPGTLSNIVETQFGYHLIRLNKREGNRINVDHILIKPKSTSGDLSYTRQKLDSLKKEIQSGKISFEKAASEYSEHQQTASNGGYLMDQGTQSTRISVEYIDPVVFFTIDSMEVGDISDPLPFRMEDNTEALRILYYKSRIPPHYANLEDDYQKLHALTRRTRENEMLEEWFENTRDQVYISIDEDYVSCTNLNNL